MDAILVVHDGRCQSGKAVLDTLFWIQVAQELFPEVPRFLLANVNAQSQLHPESAWTHPPGESSSDVPSVRRAFNVNCRVDEASKDGILIPVSRAIHECVQVCCRLLLGRGSTALSCLSWIRIPLNCACGLWMCLCVVCACRKDSWWTCIEWAH